MKTQTRWSLAASVLLSSLMLLTQPVSAAGKKRPIEWAKLPDLKTESLIVSIPSVSKLAIEGPFSIDDADALLTPHAVRWANADATRFLQQQKFSAESSREVSRNSITTVTHLCQETPIERSAEFEFRFTLDQWLESQSLWCKIGKTLFDSCRPENLNDALQIKGVVANEISSRAVEGAPKSIKINSPESCVDGTMKTAASSSYIAMKSAADLSIEQLILTRPTRDAIAAGSFSETEKDQFIIRFTARDQAIRMNAVPDQTSTTEEVITETRSIESIRIGTIALSRDSDHWVGTTTALSLLRKKSSGPLMHYRVTVQYRVSTSSNLNSKKTVRDETESKPVDLKTRSLGTLERSAWDSLTRLALSARPDSTIEGPFIVTAGARGGEIASLCDGNGDESVEGACHSVVFLSIDETKKSAELLAFAGPGKLTRFKHDFGHVAVQGQDLNEVEGAQIDQYEARVIRSKVTDRFPESSYRYFIDGQSAGDTLANVFGALTLGITLGKFERVMVPKTAFTKRFFVEAETIGSVIWIPTKDLVTLQFERIQ